MAGKTKAKLSLFLNQPILRRFPARVFHSHSGKHILSCHFECQSPLLSALHQEYNSAKVWLDELDASFL
jgi:hypothetical protein